LRDAGKAGWVRRKGNAMGKSLKVAAIIFLVLTGAGSVRAMDEEESEVTGTIDVMMQTMIAFAEKADVDQTFTDLSPDKKAVFFINDKVYDRKSLLEAFRETFGKLRSQKIQLKAPKVFLLGPDAAVWVAHGKGITQDKEGVSRTEALTETWVWKRDQGKWKVIHYHESAVPVA